MTGTSYSFILQVAWAGTGMLNTQFQLHYSVSTESVHDRHSLHGTGYFSSFVETEDVQPFVCLESEKSTCPDASKLINEREWAKPVPAAVSAHKSSLLFLLKQDKSMNLINGFDLLWKHTVEK